MEQIISLSEIWPVKRTERLCRVEITVRTIYPRNTNRTQSQTTRGFFLGLNRRLPSNKTIKGRSSSPFVTGGSSDTPVNGNMNIIPYVFIRLGWQSVWIQYSWAGAPEIKKRQTWLHFRQSAGLESQLYQSVIWISLTYSDWFDQLSQPVLMSHLHVLFFLIYFIVVPDDPSPNY